MTCLCLWMKMRRFIEFWGLLKHHRPKGGRLVSISNKSFIHLVSTSTVWHFHPVSPISTPFHTFYAHLHHNHSFLG